MEIVIKLGLCVAYIIMALLFGREIIFEVINDDDYKPCEKHTSMSRTDGRTDRRHAVS